MSIRKWEYMPSDNSYSSIALYSIILPLLLLPAFSFSQVDVINNGTFIKNTNDSVIILGNVTHALDGKITNDGVFYISGNWKNNNPSDKIFTAGNNGWVHFDSSVQTISGSTLTHFNNLNLAGTGIKHLTGVDVEIEDTLALTNREFEIGANTAFVLTTDTGAVTHTDTNGFVSSLDIGGLSRNTLYASPYFFPVGSSAGSVRYRPIDITPNEVAANSFKVRMANVDATTEGFDLSVKEAIVGVSNPNFYHRIERTSGGSKADLTIYYRDTVDGDYDIVAHWKDLSEWKNTGLAPHTSRYGFRGLTAKAFDDFSGNPFVLSLNVELSSEVYVPTIFSPNGDGHNDIMFARGKGIVEIHFVIYDRWGEKVFETDDINTGWDGTYKGQPLNLGVFVYFIQGKLKNGDEIKKKGNFTLLR